MSMVDANIILRVNAPLSLWYEKNAGAVTEFEKQKIG